MNQFNLENFEMLIEEKMKSVCEAASELDPAHDILHFQRVAGLAKRLCSEEGGRAEVVVPAAWLHDFIVVPKNDPRRSQASTLSAVAAQEFLGSIHYPVQLLDEIGHAIAAHSFSAKIKPKTLEAKIVQDADRLDGLGAIGVARCFATAGLLKRPFYRQEDPLCKSRKANDAEFTLDHFYAKLFHVGASLQTQAGQREGKRRVEFMEAFINNLSLECFSS